MNLRRLCFLALAAVFLFAPQLRAQEQLRIVAVVNEDPITAWDLNSRMRIAIVSSRLPDTPETHQRLAPQVLRALIDDQIKKQEAARQGINIQPRGVDERMNALAQENNMSMEQFESMLRQNGIPPESLREQIQTELGWVAVIRRRFQPNVIITPEDIADARNRIIESQGEPQYRVSEIFLAADDSTQLGTAEQSAQRLMEELQKGADFASVARQFSQAPTAARGGDLGWIREDDLAEELRSPLVALEPGGVAGPIQSEGGYHILLLQQRRVNNQSSVPSDDQLRDRLMSERLELLARGYLRDLRRTSFVDIRG